MKRSALEPAQFRKIALRNALLPLFLAIVLCAIFIGLIRHLTQSNEWVAHTYRAIAGAQEVLQLSVDAETGLRGYMLTKQESFLEPFEKSKVVFEDRIRALQSLVADNPGQAQRVRRIEDLRLNWNRYADHVLVQIQDPKKDFRPTGVGKALTDQIRQEISLFVSTEENLLRRRIETSQDGVRLTLLIVLTASAMIGIFLAFYSRRQLHAVSEIYGQALDKEALQTQNLQAQAWLRTGQGLVADKMRGDLSVERLCSNALDFFCEYLGGQVGTLYLVSGNELSLQAAYAVGPGDASVPKRLRMGESLVGQAARENRPLQLTEVASNYLKVSSSTGSISPSSILVAPISTDQEVKAVIEIGFVGPLNPRAPELMQLVSENVAIAINSAEYRNRLKDLLEEAQRQAEELQSQQEELRVNNEELEEQSKALKESQARMEGQQAELKQTNLQLNQQAASLEKQNETLGRTRQALEMKARELEQASEYKSQFLANMSHELRTPLNSTLILSQLLIENKSGRLAEEEIEYARTILSSSNDLLSLINDILDLAKVEAGKIDVNTETVDLEDLMKGFERTIKPIADNKGIAFSTSIEPGAPRTFVTDRFRLEQILRNLLSNAVKFTLQGSVHVAIHARSSNRISFVVKDTGIGIPRDKQRVIFDAFQQVDGTTNRQFGGTGLGLTISKDLARLLRGEISVTSESGVGSTFTLTIGALDQPAAPEREVMDIEASTPLRQRATFPAPRPPAANPSRPDDRDQLQPGLRLLMVVEDDPTFSKVLFDLSHENDFQCLLAETAEEAIALAEHYLPHAIILDMKLPDHSGLFVLDRLKENPATRHIPVHVISAEDVSDAALKMGAIGYLTKPSNKSKLVEVIRKLEAKLTQRIKKILIIEDNTVQRESMQKLLTDENVKVEAVSSGRAALDLLRTTSYDCVVLDLSLPDMTGDEVLESMSTTEGSSYPPVIVYTARQLTRDEEERLQKYSRSIILKGAKSPERLMSEVSLFLHQVESQMPPERQRALKELRDREQDLEGRLILLVDDDVRNVFALMNALERRGAKVEIARNGREAVAKVQSVPHIELVLMDVMMPEMNGLDATREIRKDERFKSLPIIAVTAKAMADDHEKCLEAGANDYLAKPIDLPKLLSLIRIWLRPAKRL